jgi:hypothetical protein
VWGYREGLHQIWALSEVEKIRNLSVLVGLRKVGDLRR